MCVRVRARKFKCNMSKLKYYILDENFEPKESSYKQYKLFKEDNGCVIRKNIFSKAHNNNILLLTTFNGAGVSTFYVCESLSRVMNLKAPMIYHFDNAKEALVRFMKESQSQALSKR